MREEAKHNGWVSLTLSLDIIARMHDSVGKKRKNNSRRITKQASCVCTNNTKFNLKKIKQIKQKRKLNSKARLLHQADRAKLRDRAAADWPGDIFRRLKKSRQCALIDPIVRNQNKYRIPMRAIYQSTLKDPG